MIIKQIKNDSIDINVTKEEAQIIAMWIQLGSQNTQLSEPELNRTFINFASSILECIQNNSKWDIDCLNIDKYTDNYE